MGKIHLSLASNIDFESHSANETVYVLPSFVPSSILWGKKQSQRTVRHCLIGFCISQTWFDSTKPALLTPGISLACLRRLRNDEFKNGLDLDFAQVNYKHYISQSYMYFRDHNEKRQESWSYRSGPSPQSSVFCTRNWLSVVVSKNMHISALKRTPSLFGKFLR